MNSFLASLGLCHGNRNGRAAEEEHLKPGAGGPCHTGVKSTCTHSLSFTSTEAPNEVTVFYERRSSLQSPRTFLSWRGIRTRGSGQNLTKANTTKAFWNLLFSVTTFTDPAAENRINL